LVEYFDRPDLRVAPGLNLEPEVSNIQINQDGSVFYNGQEITRDIKRTCGTPVPASKDPSEASALAPKPAEAPPKPKVKPKPQVKPQVKPKIETQPAPKKSSVSVFNGPKEVISDAPELIAEESVEKPLEKAPVVDDNSIDVEDLNAQDNKDDTIKGDSDDDSIIEGQYP